MIKTTFVVRDSKRVTKKPYTTVVDTVIENSHYDTVSSVNDKVHNWKYRKNNIRSQLWPSPK